MFQKTLSDLRGGLVLVELDEKIKELVNACDLTGKGGTLTLQIKLKPRGNTGQMEITDEVKTTLPKFDRGLTMMFSTPEGNLMRDDPRQAKLDLKVLPKEETKVVQLKQSQS